MPVGDKLAGPEKEAAAGSCHDKALPVLEAAADEANKRSEQMKTPSNHTSYYPLSSVCLRRDPAEIPAFLSSAETFIIPLNFLISSLPFFQFK